MCTTFLLTELIREFSDYDVIGYPRLVRLNPMVPWKTRGNGALSVRLGRGGGRKRLIGRIGEVKIYGCERERKDVFDVGDMKRRIERLFDEYAEFNDMNTNPAFVIAGRKPPASLYWRAVREIVPLETVVRILDASGAVYRGYKNGRGLVGAASAISWVPNDSTYEITAYREKSRWGTKRKINPLSVIEMDEAFPETFNNYDYANKHVCIAPSSPCPVLFGIRADIPHRLVKASSMVSCNEPVERFFIFQTNQGTDDHIRERKISGIAPLGCVKVAGEVSQMPRSVPGGHTIFRLGDGTGEIDCAAYEPSKQFRKTVRKLAPGDQITVYGGVRDEPRTINVEKLHVRRLAKISVKESNPVCGQCGRRMKSAGMGAGYRCRRCGTRAEPGDAVLVGLKRELKTGLYEPPASARRHLSKPLKRMDI
jgi:tRNA(Ile2)-agmatinylcytidine synthase